MRKVNCVVQLTIGVLLSVPSIADEAKSFNANRDPVPLVTSSAAVWLTELKSASREFPPQPIKAMGYRGARLRPIADFDFNDAGVLTRFNKFRSLALVTVAETGQARFFLGVNERGVLGLHFSAWRRHGAMRNLELLRMPYLEKHAPGS